jgi:flagellar basal body-associated protein FliL
MIKTLAMVGGGLALGLIVVAATLLGVAPIPVGPVHDAQVAAAQATAAALPPVTVMFPTKERIVNLTDKSATRYLKVQMTLEFLDHKLKEPPKGAAIKTQQDDFAAEMEPYGAIIDDTLNTVLSSKTSQDLIKPDGKDALKGQLKESLTHALHDEEQVVNVYFTEFIIQ